MTQAWVCICVLVACVDISIQASTPASPTYRAAVVEYASVYVPNNSEETLKRNADAYVKYINDAGQQKVDIIVFPEDGVTSVGLPDRPDLEPWATLIPPASDNHTPCTANATVVYDALKKISCAARNSGVYVVVNVAEKLPCSGDDCPTDKFFYYNSNVVFDRTGKIIARYRKTNLVVEPIFNVTDQPEIVTFDTDFGVKFGTFVCFDILFQQPGLNLTRIQNVTDFVYPTAWFSETPFLTAIQVQSAWSYAEDVNLLASGYNRPLAGNSGSGIYLGRQGTGKAILPLTSHSELLVYDVPKKSKSLKGSTKMDFLHVHRTAADNPSQHIAQKYGKRVSNLSLLVDDLTVFETVPFANSTEKKVCHGKFCCDFTVTLGTVDPKTRYRFAAFQGERTYASVINSGVASCAIIQCANDTINSCGSVQESETVFRSIKISATFHDYYNHLIMPVTLTTPLVTFGDYSYTEHAHDDHAHVGMTLAKDTKNLLVFGVYAREYARDSKLSSANANVVSVLAVATSVLLLRLLR